MGCSKDKNARCPFYRGTSASTIGCEGPVDRSKTTHAFEDESERDLFKQHNCDKWYKYCPWYVGLMTKYGDELVRE